MKGVEFNEGQHLYRLDGKRVKGVTTIINGGVPKGEALTWWAVKRTAYKAHEHRGYLPEDREAAYDLLKKAWIDDRDKAGVTGTEVHSMAEKLMTTGEVEIAPEKEALILPYVEGFAAFLDEWEIEPVLSEVFVASRKHRYCGRLDLIGRIPSLHGDGLVMIDLKTSGGVYDTVALQNAAYARAEFWQKEPGTPEVPMPEIVATYVAHVTPTRAPDDPEDHTKREGRYKGTRYGTTLHRCAGTPEEIDDHFNTFLAAHRITHRKIKLTEMEKAA